MFRLLRWSSTTNGKLIAAGAKGEIKSDYNGGYFAEFFCLRGRLFAMPVDLIKEVLP